MLRDSQSSKTKRLRKNVVKIFKNYALSITSKTNLKIVDYLDVTFDLQNNSCKPYRKPDNLPVYILRKGYFTSDLFYTPKQLDHKNNNEENKKR